MSMPEVAAEQLKCVRVLSQILVDGALTMPTAWTIHTFSMYEPPLTSQLEGFVHLFPTPAYADLRALLQAYADRFGAKVEEKPHGQGGRIALHVTVMWQGVELHVWGPALPEGGAA